LLYGSGTPRALTWFHSGARAVEYQRHKPQDTLLHQVIRENLETFLANARERGPPVARFVVRELRDEAKLRFRSPASLARGPT
jgi:hypothetical protein